MHYLNCYLLGSWVMEYIIVSLKISNNGTDCCVPQLSVNALVSLGFMFMVSPWLSFLALPVLIGPLMIRSYASSAMRDLKRLEAKSKFSVCCCWKLFIRSTIYHLTNDYLLQWAICCSSGLPFSVFFSGLTPEKLVRSPTCHWSWPNKSVPIKMSSRVVCSRCWGVG